MEYSVKIGKKIIKASVEISDNNQLEIFIGDSTYYVDYRKINNFKSTLIVNGINHFVSVNNYSGKKNVIINGYGWLCEDADKIALNNKKKGRTENLPDLVTPPMPAVVVSVFAEKGAEVSKGDKLVVVSAMKMETTLKAPFDGIVTSVNAEEGKKVNPGDILVDIMKNDDGGKNE